MTIWLLLVASVVVGVLGSRSLGLFSFVIVLPLAWVGVLLLEGFIPMLELNSPALLLRHLGPTATGGVLSIAIPLALTYRTRALRRMMAWGVAGASIWAFVLPLPVLLVSCHVLQDCL
jgi:hypothetical protein